MSRKKRTKSNHRQEIEYLEQALKSNTMAVEDGPKRKKWNIHDLKTIRPLTIAQEDMFHAFFNCEDSNICAHGSAGTGKTFLALYLALVELLDTQAQTHLIIVRSVVPTRDIGHLPGTLEEKVSEYEAPYHDMMYELIGRPSTYTDMKNAGLVKFVTTSFIRGLTWDNAIVIIDEGENMTFHEIDSVMTRIGKNTRVIFTGDSKQTDLTRKHDATGMPRFLEVIKKMKEFEQIMFTKHDIVRSHFVKSWITASEDTPE